jgi:hypothetical protein
MKTKTKTKRSKISLTRKRFSRKRANKRGGKSNRRRYRTNKSKKYSRKRSKKYKKKYNKKGGAAAAVPTITLNVMALYSNDESEKKQYVKYDINIQSDASVPDVKAKIQEETEVDAERQTLILRGMPMRKKRSDAGEYEVFPFTLENDDNIMMIADVPRPSDLDKDKVAGFDTNSLIGLSREPEAQRKERRLPH